MVGETIMFNVTPTAQKYIMKKGGEVKVYLELYHASGG
jgi:hypothetical protein